LKIGDGCACLARTITYLQIKFITQNFNYQIYQKLMRFLIKPNKIKENAMQIAQKMEINALKSLFLLFYFIKSTTHYHSKIQTIKYRLFNIKYDIVDMKI